MKVLCIFLTLLFNNSYGMNSTCQHSVLAQNGTVKLYDMCNVSAVVGKNLMSCNFNETQFSCSLLTNTPEVIASKVLNIGSVFGWLWLGGRAVYKCFRTSPREDYMRGRFQLLLSSEILGCLITIPSIISIFTDSSWGSHLISLCPLLVGGIQCVYDVFKMIRACCRKNRRVKLFDECMNQLDEDIGYLKSEEPNKSEKKMKKIESSLTWKLYEWACDEFEMLKDNFDRDTKDDYIKTINNFHSLFKRTLKTTN